MRELGITGKIGSAHVDTIVPVGGAASVASKVVADQTPYLPFGASAKQGNDFLVGASPPPAVSLNQAAPVRKPNDLPWLPAASRTSERPSLDVTARSNTAPAPVPSARDSAGGTGESLPRTVVPASPSFLPRVSLIPAELSIPQQSRVARERHKMVVMLHCSGMTTYDICKATGYKSAAVGIILRSHNPELVQLRRDFGGKVAKAMETTVYQKFQLLAVESVDRLGDHMRDHEDKTNSRHAAVAILDRAGHSPVKKQLTLGGNIPADELKMLISQLSQLNEVSARESEWALTPVGG